MSREIILGSQYASKFEKSVRYVGIPSQGGHHPAGGKPIVRSNVSAPRADNKNPMAHQGVGFTFQQQRARARKGGTK